MEISLSTVAKVLAEPAFAVQVMESLKEAPLSIDGEDWRHIELECETKKKNKPKKCSPVCACGSGYWAAR